MKQEIFENILSFKLENKKIYYDYLLDRLKNTEAFSINKNSINKWLKRYKSDLNVFPEIYHPELKKLLDLNYSFLGLPEKEKSYILDIQIDFYWYASMIETKKVISFIEDQFNDLLPLKKVGSQLSTNQIVILLDKLDFFNLPKIKDLPKTKQAYLISLIIRFDKTNIKKKIHDLEKKPSELGDSYQKDIDIVEDILNNLG